MKRPLLAACAALGILVLLGLGTWQVVRLQWKQDLIARTEALTGLAPVPLLDAVGDGIRSTVPAGGPIPPGPVAEYTPVVVTGGFPTERTLHVVGTLDGASGYYVFQPFQPDGADVAVLVNRGFVRRDERRESYPLPDADRLTALLRRFDRPRALAPPPDEDGRTAYDRSFPTLVGAFGETAPEAAVFETGFAPFYLDSTLPTERPRGGTTRLDFSNRHLGYAVTWYGLAAGLLAVYLVMARKR